VQEKDNPEMGRPNPLVKAGEKGGGGREVDCRAGARPDGKGKKRGNFRKGTLSGGEG